MLRRRSRRPPRSSPPRAPRVTGAHRRRPVDGGLTRVLEHEAGDLTCTVEAGIRLSCCKRRCDRPASDCRSTRQGTRRSERASPAGCPALSLSFRHAARPRPRRDRRARRRHRRELRREGREERRRLRPRQAAVRLRGKARAAGARGAAPPSAARRVRDAPRRDRDPGGVVLVLRASQLQPSALDVIHPGRVAVRFEGGERAVAAQLASARRSSAAPMSTTPSGTRRASARGAHWAGCASPPRPRASCRPSTRRSSVRRQGWRTSRTGSGVSPTGLPARCTGH